MATQNKRLALIGLLAVLFLAIGFGTRMSIKAMSPVPTKLGVYYGRLKACPETANCVCSQATRDENKIAPISFAGVDRQIAYLALSEIVDAMPRANVLVSRIDYVHVEFSTLWLGCRDDSEFWLDDTTGRIEVRSAARLGKDDGGRNRDRVEEIRGKFQEKLKQQIKG